jgi:hypothetical protein
MIFNRSLAWRDLFILSNIKFKKTSSSDLNSKGIDEANHPVPEVSAAMGRATVPVLFVLAGHFPVFIALHPWICFFSKPSTVGPPCATQ